MTTPISIEKLAAKNGLLIAIAFVVYFLIMQYFGLLLVAELRFLNFFILLAGLTLTIRSYKIKANGGINYLEGFSLGIYTSIVSFALFSLFVFIYFNRDPLLLDLLKVDAPIMGKHLTPLFAALSVMVEGIVAGLITSFALMQYFKTDVVHNK